MLRNGINYQTKRNKGMTLVELLVAVVIFAIAIVPMLYAFVYSTGYNFKAQQTFQSTGIAQAIIEKAKSPGLDLNGFESAILATYPVAHPGDPLTSTVLDNTVFLGGSPTDNGSHSYTLNDVRAINLESGDNRRLYDVEITMTPGSTRNLSVIRSMSDRTANFTDNNSSFTSSVLLYEDSQAVDKLISLVRTATYSSNANFTIKNGVSVVPQASWPVSDPSIFFNDSDIDKDLLVIRRVIDISMTASAVNMHVDYYCGGFYGTGGALGNNFEVSKNVTIGGTTYTIICKYLLNNPGDSDPYKIVTSGNYVPASGDKPFYQAKYNGSTNFTLYADPNPSLAGDSASALYFYYYPAYDTDSSSDSVDFFDSFVISNSINKSDVADSDGFFDMYFYKQYNSASSMTPAQYNHCEQNYAPYFKVTNSSSDMKLNFYNNFLYDVRATDYYNLTPEQILMNYANSFSGKLQSDGSSTLLNFPSTVINKTLHPKTTTSDPNLRYLPYDWDSCNLPHGTVVTTYSITVNVYKDGESVPVETMSCEVVNW